MTNASISEPRPRLVTLHGGCNFRDIGGYATQGGGTVRWGRVYRAGVLSYFTDRDHDTLHSLEVRAICDLRRAEEREREPSAWPAGANRERPAHLHWDDGSRTPTIRAFAANHPTTAEGMFDAMIELYRALPEWMAARMRGMFECIANGSVPLVVHCAAGKDRTGVAIAVLLRALDVSRETAIEDYLLTNESGDFEQFLRARHDTQLGLTDIHHPLLSMPDDIRRVLFSAHAEFLEAAFASIDKLGGLDRYLEKTVGVTNAQRAAVVQELSG
ncbi:MAG TPA: tyrosine-protein phosphatase [Steroidobacteraceae bacterium]|nr:tyrosine-protein phosphatase [Steroidobacteraceae bacterium]